MFFNDPLATLFRPLGGDDEGSIRKIPVLIEH